MTDFANNMKGVDTTKVEVDDDDQAPPEIALGSTEEAELMQELDMALASSGIKEKWEAFRSKSKFKELPLWCLRGRKYDVQRAAELLAKLIDAIEELQVESGDAKHLSDHLGTHKILATGTKDARGRPIIWVRLRYHDPKVYPAIELGKLVAAVMLHVLRDPDAQRLGVVICNDMTGLKLKNLDPGAPKVLFGKVLSNLPIRVGRICIFNPPWVVGHIVLPIMMTFMSSKLKSRIAVLNGSKVENLTKYFPRESLPQELGGTTSVDSQQFIQSVVS